jgi:CheY-like chemotaxis protein
VDKVTKPGVQGISDEEGKVSVLVIENEKDVRLLLSDILTSGGHRVASASDGIEALQIFKKECFDLVLTDLGMPAMSGWEVASTIKKMAPDVIIVIITGWGSQLDHSELEKNGVDMVVSKPFRVDQILNLVQEAREIKNRMQQGRA